MWKYIAIFLALTLSYTVDLRLGLVVTVIGVGIMLFLLWPSLYAVRGNKAFSEGNMSAAKKFYQKAYETGRAKVKVRIRYAVLLMRLGVFEKAETVLNEIVLDKKIPNEKKVLAKQYRALLYFKLGRAQDAMDEATALYKGNFRDTTTYGLLGYLKLATNQPLSETLDFCIEAYEYNAHDRDIQDNLVLAYYKRGEYIKAKEYADALIKNHPQFVEAVYHSALIALQTGNQEQAVAYMETIDDCNRTALTTVSVEEVEELKNKLGMA